MSLIEILKFIANPFRFSRNSNSEGINAVLNELSILQERTTLMALNLETLAKEVARVQTVQESAVTLLKSLVTELQKISNDLHECHDDPADLAALDELTSKLKSSTDALAGAVAESDDVFEVPADPVPAAPVEPEAPAEPAPVVEEPVAEAPVEAPAEPVVEAPVEAPVEDAPVAEPEAPAEGEPEAPVDETPAE